MTANSILHLQEAYDLFNEYITDKSMEINIDKSELLSDDIEDTIIDKTTNKSIRTLPHSKYLGQKINNKFEAEDVI